jgi:hypothetical protein
MRRFDITHDYLCPFARNASRVVIPRWRAALRYRVQVLDRTYDRGHTNGKEVTCCTARGLPCTTRSVWTAS